MEKRLKEVLNREEGNYILPFFWQHGEDGGRLREMMGAVYSSGIRAVCVESRPHPDFAGPGWWRDMDIIMDEARKRNMRVWVLDDAHFPSGYCNGLVEEQSVYAKRYLDHYTIDASGPGTGTSFFLSIDEGEELIGVVAAPEKGQNGGRSSGTRGYHESSKGKRIILGHSGGLLEYYRHNKYIFRQWKKKIH